MFKKTTLSLLVTLVFSATLSANCCEQYTCFHGLEPVLQDVRNGIINPYTTPELFIESAKKANNIIPEETKHQLEMLRDNKIKCGYVILEGIPLDFPLPSTPKGEFPPKKESFVSEFCLSIFGTVIGEPFNYIQEEQGNIFRNVRPLPTNASNQTSDSSKVLLELHTETAFHPFKPDFLMLNCLRGDRNHEALTLVSSLSDFLPLLDEETVRELRTPQFLTGVDVSFGNPEKTKYVDRLIPVIYGTEGEEMITYDLDLMTGTTPEAESALEKLTQAILNVQKGVLLEPGKMLIFDNKRIIHGRTAFKAYYDGEDRWLQRVYISIDPDFRRQVNKTGRVITKQF